jgi:hypothetical protein
VTRLVQTSALALFLAVLVTLAACSSSPIVATDVQVVEKPIPVPCLIKWPEKPVPHVANVQLTGEPLLDLVLIWRAAEAELEERIAYELKLEAAMQACARRL